jgi:hypothetical protein
VALPEKDNKWGMSFMKQETDLTNEAKAARVVDPTKARFWKIKNPAKKHVYSGEPPFFVPLLLSALPLRRRVDVQLFTRSACHSGLCSPSCSMCRAARDVEGPAEALHCMRIAPRLAGLRCCGTSFLIADSARKLDNYLVLYLLEEVLASPQSSRDS